MAVEKMMKVLTLLLVLCAGCQSMKSLPDSTMCSGILTTFNPKAHWTETGPDDSCDYFVGPVATLRLLTPSRHVDRMIDVRFRGEGAEADAVSSSMASQTGVIYRVTLPSDFLEGNYGSINFEDVNHIEKVKP